METERLILRYFKMEDAKDVFETWGQDHDVSKYMLWKNYETVDDAKKAIKFFQEQIEKDTGFICYAIVRKEDNKLIGHFTFNKSKKHNHAEIGYLLGKEFQNKGYMSEVLNKIVSYYFNEGLVRISAEVMVDNIASIKLLEKCLFKREGRLIKKYKKNNEYHDVFNYAIINGKYLQRWSFGEKNNELIKLVLDGKKTATTSNYDENELPFIGEQSIIVDDNKIDKCIVETVDFKILKFKDITSDLSDLEGEGNFESWRKNHINFFKKFDKNFNDETLVVFEIFKLIKKIYRI